jgi:hypothetical protein
VILRSADGALHLITQPDHAALAGRIMQHWMSLATAERREAILRAVYDHDNGWREPDASPTWNPDTGRPFDFVTIPAAVRQGVWPHAVAALADAPWAAALVAHHALTVYDRFRADTSWDAFFVELEDLRARRLAAAGGTMDLLVRDYVYVRLGDLVSLVFCNAWTEAQVLGPWTIRLDAGQLLVEPNPFARDVPIEVEARALPDLRYDNQASLQAAWRAAPRTAVRGVVVGRERTS